MMNRRVFAKSLVAGSSAAALPSLAGAQPGKQPIGCTALVWGALPRTPENFQRLGYTFTTT